MSKTPDTDKAFEAFARGACGTAYLCARMAEIETERDSAKTLNRTLLDQLEAKDAQIEAMLRRDSERLESDSIVGSCDCLTKTPEVKYHKPGCKYRLICERDEARECSNKQAEMLACQAKRNAELQEQISAEKSTRDAIIKKGAEMERELEAMREAIKDAHYALGYVYNGGAGSSTFPYRTDDDLCSENRFHHVKDALDALAAFTNV